MRAPSARTRKLARLCAGPIAVLLTGLMVWQGSTAAFTATASNDGNLWKLSEVEVGLTNDSRGALFNAQNVAPGQTGQRCVTVKSTSNLPGEVRFYVSSVGGRPEMTDHLNLTVERGTGSTYNGGCTSFRPVSGASSAQSLTTLGAAHRDYATGIVPWRIAGTLNESAAYRVTWLYEDPGFTADEIVEYAGEEMGANLVWELQTDVSAPSAS